MKPVEIPGPVERPRYEVTMLPGARPEFRLLPLWDGKVRPEIVVDGSGQPVLLLNIRARKGTPRVDLSIALTSEERAQLVEVLQQQVRVDEV